MKKLKENLEILIANQFWLNIPATVVSVNELRDAVSHAPSWWEEDPNSKHNAIFI